VFIRFNECPVVLAVELLGLTRQHSSLDASTHHWGVVISLKQRIVRMVLNLRN
jgi:hypothetical protein